MMDMITGYVAINRDHQNDCFNVSYFLKYDMYDTVVYEDTYESKGTHNEAFYHGIIETLLSALQYSPDILTIATYSELAVKQINGEYKTRKSSLRNLLIQVIDLIKTLENNDCSVVVEYRPKGEILCYFPCYYC